MSYAEESLSGYREALKSLINFGNNVRDVASDLAEAKDGLPLVVVINELDRRRPSYADELLETAKHIFAADHVVFVVAVNRSDSLLLARYRQMIEQPRQHERRRTEDERHASEVYRLVELFSG